MAIIKTKIVNSLPEVGHLEPNTQYFLKNNEKFDLFVTDNNKALRQLQIDVNENLLRQSATFMSLNQVLTTGYITTRLWDATPVVYGLINTTAGSEVWGVHSRGVAFNSELFIKDLTNKQVTISVDVKPLLKTDIGLGVVQGDVVYKTVEANTWERISITYSGARMPAIWAKLAEGVTVSGKITALSNYIYFKNWKVEEGSVATTWCPAISDYADNASHYVKTYRLPQTGAFRTDTLIENQFQNGKTVGLANANTTVTISFSVYTFKCRYLFLMNNTTLTLTGTPAIISNSDQSQNNVFKGNRGDYVDVEFFQDQSNSMQVVAWQTKLTNDRDYAISVTENIALNTSHVGRILQFNNTGNITVDITNLPAMATVSGVKNSGAGTVTFTGTTAPSSDNVMNTVVNSSFSLIKNASGTSNLLISNK